MSRPNGGQFNQTVAMPTPVMADINKVTTLATDRHVRAASPLHKLCLATYTMWLLVGLCDITYSDVGTSGVTGTRFKSLENVTFLNRFFFLSHLKRLRDNLVLSKLRR